MHSVPLRFRLPTVALVAATTLVGVTPTAGASGSRNDDEALGGPQLATTGSVVNLAPGQQGPPSVSAASYVLADLDTGAILAAKNPHGQFAPASTLKTLTAVTFIPRLDPDAKVKATWDDAAVDGTKVGVVPGMRYTVRELFAAMLMMSANDAAMAIATAEGSAADGLRAMNAEARRLRALDTVAKTPNGLDANGQYSSAYDLALISRAGLAMPDFRKYVATRRSHFSAPHHKRYEIYTHDHLLLNYRGAFGVKNGYTVAAQASFVGAAERRGHRLVVALMRGRPDVWRDGAQLLTWGFKSIGSVVACGQLVEPEPVVTPAAPVAQTASQTVTLTKRTAGAGWDVPRAPLAAAGTIVVLFTALRVRARRRYRRTRPRSKFSLPPI